MKRSRENTVFLVFLLAYQVHARLLQKGASGTSVNLLNKLSNSNGQNPLIVFLENEKTQSKNLPKTANVDEDVAMADDGLITEEDHNYIKVEAQEEAKYLMYDYLLRSAPDEDGEIKDALRQALYNKCKKVDTCQKKCTEKKTYECSVTCKEVFDNLNLCEAPKPKKDPCNQGKTMPPKW